MRAFEVNTSAESEQMAVSEFSRADRRCGVDRLLQQPRVMIRHAEMDAVPEADYRPKSLLMGRADRLLAPGEAMLPRYYALQDRTAMPQRGEPVDLLCTPRIGGAVIALYGSPVDAGIARAVWFQGQYPGLPAPELFYRETLGVREISQAEALGIRRDEAIRRGEAVRRGEVLPIPLAKQESRSTKKAILLLSIALGLAWVCLHLSAFPAH